MPFIRFTGFFKDDDGHGWSEQHDKDGGGSITSLTAYLTAFDSMMRSFRQPILCADSFYLGCRASFKDNFGTHGDNVYLDPPQRGPQTYMGQGVDMDAPEVSVKARIRNAGATARSDVYLRGQPRQLTSAGVLQLGDLIGAEWKRRLDAYMAELVGKGYGWIGIDPATTSRGTVTGYTQNPNLTVTFNVTPTNAIALPAAGTKLSVKFARINRSRSALNRLLVCRVEPGGAAVTSQEQIAVSDFDTEGTYIAQSRGFIPYAAVSYYKLARRKTGRPFGVGPGRSPAVVRI